MPISAYKNYVGMRLPFSRFALIRASLLFGVWTAYGLLCVWQSHYWNALGHMTMSWKDAFRYQMTYAYAWAAASPLVLHIARRFRLGGAQWRRNLLVHIVALFTIVPAVRIVFDAVARPPLSPFRAFTFDKLFHMMQADFDLGLLLYCMLVLVEHATVFHARYEAGLMNASQLQTQLVQAQLQALKMQLHPHFLFNTLHTIAALVHDEPDLAELTITRLGDLLRLFLANSSVHEVPLSEELHILDLYLQIERARFEERLHAHYDVPDALREATVPNLLLQPLVENSIRHGLSKRAEAGWISVTAERYGETLVLRVTDNGAGFNGGTPLHKGMGLSITRGRLESLYGVHQSLVLKNLPAGGVEARITMPFRSRAVPGQEPEKQDAELQSTNC